MGTWQVTSDLLAKARFAMSPKAEAVGALEALMTPSDPAERAFRAAHHVAFEAMLDEHPVRRDLLACSFRPRRGSKPGWLACLRSRSMSTAHTAARAVATTSRSAAPRPPIRRCCAAPTCWCRC